MLDVLKRYLLIVWNFFFGQTSSESIQDSPKDQPEDSVDIIPPVEVDDEIINEEEDDVDDIEEISDVEGENDDEEEGEDDDESKEADKDQVQKVDIPKKPEDKIVINDVPTKPNNLADKFENVKDPDVLKTKDPVEIKNFESPKINDEEIKEKEKPKVKSDEIEKKETPKLKPEFEAVEKESPKVVPSKLKSDFEIIEREAETKLPDTSELKPEFEIVEREVSKVVPAKNTPELKPEVEIKGKEATPKAIPEKQDTTAIKPEVLGTGGSKEPAKEFLDKNAPEPSKFDTKVPEKSGKNVKFEVDEVKKSAPDSPGIGDVKISPKSSPLPDRKETRPRDEFLVSENGAGIANNQTHVRPDVAGGPKKTENPIDAFISGEQKHTVRQLHPESIQDQQLDYSDSGEELSDDDIEIDYEDDEDDEEVEEVKPLPPVARSVYKKND